MEELNQEQLDEVSGGNARDTVTGSFAEESPGTMLCYALFDRAGISRTLSSLVCE